MRQFKNSSSKLAAVASVLAFAACGGQQSQPNTPSSAQNGQSTSDQYGSAMGQPNSAGSATPSDTSPSVMGQPSATGTGDSYGTQGTGSSATYGTTPGSSQGTMGQGTGQGSTSMGSTGMNGSDHTGSYGGAAPTYGAGGSSQTGSIGATSTMGGSIDVSSLNESQLAAVVQAINQGEMQEAQLAQTKASSQEVKRFAQHMMTEHRDMQNKTSSLLSRMQMTPSESPVSTQLKSDAQNELSTLQGETGHDFDRSYVDAQVKNHNQALELIDRMVPNVKSSEFKSHLQSARTKVDQHLREAERLQQAMEQGSPGTTNKQRGSTTQPH